MLPAVRAGHKSFGNLSLPALRTSKQKLPRSDITVTRTVIYNTPLRAVPMEVNHA